MAHPDLDSPAYRNRVMKNTIAMDIGRILMLGFFLLLWGAFLIWNTGTQQLEKLGPSGQHINHSTLKVIGTA